GELEQIGGRPGGKRIRPGQGPHGSRNDPRRRTAAWTGFSHSRSFAGAGASASNRRPNPSEQLWRHLRLGGIPFSHRHGPLVRSAPLHPLTLGVPCARGENTSPAFSTRVWWRGTVDVAPRVVSTAPAA